MNVLEKIVLIIFALPIIIVLFKMAAGLMAIFFVIAGILTWRAGNPLLGIVLIIVAIICAKFAPKYDEDKDEWEF